jgi:signal transduction histidine kinase
VTWYGEPEGLSIGTISAIHAGSYFVAAGERFVAILHEGRFHTLRATETPAALEGVGGIVEAHDGDLWLNGARGAVRIAADALREAVRSGSFTVALEVFDTQDGFPGVSQRVWPLPTLKRGTDDRLWFAGTAGVGWLDPRRIRRNTVAPPLHIRSVLSDGRAYPHAEGAQLPQGAHNLQINYTATSLSRPERVRFRYRLDGYDEAWVDAGARRSAFYTNLPPSSYRFQVSAANETGLWNEAGAAVTIVIPPTFTQTRAFLALCAIAALALLWAAYAVRIRQVTARERSRLQERLSERERIARELHDTLLQGMQGLILEVQAAANTREPSRQALNEALDRADALLAEARDRVKDLRGSAAAPVSLRQRLLETVEHVSAEERAKLHVIERGTPRDLYPSVREEAVSIASEAMMNALRHAAATTIEIEVSYERRCLRINVRDDGRGMEGSIIQDGREGHFGLVGMQERTRRIRGHLNIWSRPGAGTEVSLTVPASIAYVRRRWLRLAIKDREYRASAQS